ncbi:hypothetical protein [Mycobacterium hubeiense]|uniref:hypothetical protein n=1 Tax=Mycobacterium hubeiense TaxID=1867256 RepID=UPI000C7E9763|nr:hypothetical protein [Mycobacterium sp. QGD 101]
MWIDDTRIDHSRRGRRRRATDANAKANAELSNVDGTVELLVPIDIGALGKTVTVRFPMAALLRLNQA